MKKDNLIEVELIREMYVFVAMQHRATSPWRKSLSEWQKKVEKKMGWNAHEEISKFRKNIESTTQTPFG